MQAPAQGLSQQNPSWQTPVAHSFGPEHGVAGGETVTSAYVPASASLTLKKRRPGPASPVTGATQAALVALKFAIPAGEPVSGGPPLIGIQAATGMVPCDELDAPPPTSSGAKN
jgi:hypothetical protein